MELLASSFTISIAISVCVFLFALAISGVTTMPRRMKLSERIRGAQAAEIEAIVDEVKEQSWFGRRIHAPYLKPLIHRNPTTLQKIARALSVNLEKLHSDIKEAGMENRISAEEIVSMKLIGLVVASIFVILGLPTLDLLFIGIGVFAFYIGSYMPSQKITEAKKKRRDTIIAELPDFLRLLKAVTESGNTIQEAINKVSVRTSGPLAKEFQNVMVETKANGGNWRQAMENMAIRNDIDALSDVVSNILIAVERGTSIVDILEKDADIMLALRNSKVMEKAKGLSVKMMIPMALFDFLPLMVLMLAPMMMQFSEGI